MSEVHESCSDAIRATGVPKEGPAEWLTKWIVRMMQELGIKHGKLKVY